MNLEIQAALLALGIALPLTFALRLPTRRERRHSDHNRHIPRVGGISIVVAFVLAPIILSLVSGRARDFLKDDWSEFLALAVCSSIVLAVGAVDDFRNLGWKPKVAAQLVASIGLYLFGFRIGEMTLPFRGTVDLGFADPIVTVFWLLLITNAVNLLDGRDGLASGVTVLVSATMAFVAWDLGHDLIALLFAALAGASLGFIPANLPYARRFLGDSGAYFLGFTIAALSIAGFVDSTGRVPLYIPLVALGLPVLDTGLACLRRFLDGRNPFEADTDHVHDRLERIFALGRINLALVTYGLTAIFCGAALLLHAWYKDVGSAVVSAAVIVFAVVLLGLLGYVETLWNSARLVTLRGRRPGSAAREAH